MSSQDHGLPEQSTIQNHVALPTHDEEIPQRRYASLHRALEQGKESDASWVELTKVCVQIGNTDEAVKAARNVKDAAERHHLERYLMRLGLMERPSERTRREEKERVTVNLESTFKDEVSSAFRFLFEDHMPLTVMVATLTFPLVIGLGGFLTSGSNALLFPAIALIPVLTILGLVGALARQILVEASEGLDDAPRIPELSQLGHSATRFLLDAMALGCLFLAPGLVCLFIGMPLHLSLATLAVGGLLAPMALALRQLRNDWQSISPKVLFPAITRAGMPYLGAALMFTLLFSPAVAAAVGTMGSDLYLQASFVGPLCVAPLFITSRLTGRVMHLRRESLGELLVGETAEPVKAENKKAATSPQRTPQRPSPRPSQRPPMGSPMRQKAGTQRAGAQRTGARTTPAQRAAAQKAKARTSPLGALGALSHPEAQGQAKRPKAKLPSSLQSQSQPQVIGEAPPDLTNMPGMRVLRGEEREKAGAAVPIKSRDHSDLDWE